VEEEPRFDINRDFSWIAFGCLLVVLVLFALFLVVSRVFSPAPAGSVRPAGSPGSESRTEIVVENLAVAAVVFKVEDSAGARFYLAPVGDQTVIDIHGPGDPAADFIRLFALDCDEAQVVVVGGESSFGSGGTITVDPGGLPKWEKGHDQDSLADGWSPSGFATCQQAAASGGAAPS
jgi:hypothetical protein